jgi:hypothetical protein
MRRLSAVTLVALSLTGQAHAVVQEPHWVLVEINGADFKFGVDVNNIKALGSKREFWVKMEYQHMASGGHWVMDCDKDTFTDEDGSTTPIRPDVAYMVSIEKFVCGSDHYRKDMEAYMYSWEKLHCSPDTGRCSK